MNELVLQHQQRSTSVCPELLGFSLLQERLNRTNPFVLNLNYFQTNLLTETTDLIPGMRASNAYLRKTEAGELILIDSGMPGNAKRIAEYILGRNLDPKSLSLLLLTHADIDHAGSIWELKQKFAPDAKVAIHTEDAPRVSGEKKNKEVKGAMGVRKSRLSYQQWIML